MTGELPPRTEDVFRHLEDLRSHSYEGARDWPDRVEVFRRAVSLLDPVVREVLAEADTDFLAGTGMVGYDGDGDGDSDGGVYARWELSWPRQREATRDGGQVEPVQVMAVFGRRNTHPHLRGAATGRWPCQVTGEADARRQELVIRAIVEAELHERIFQGGWEIIPAFTAGDGG